MFLNLRRSLVVVICVSFASTISFAAGGEKSPENESQYTNHLINEKSPYLLEHAHNPVDWYPGAKGLLRRPEKRTNPYFSRSAIQRATGVT